MIKVFYYFFKLITLLKSLSTLLILISTQLLRRLTLQTSDYYDKLLANK